MNFPKSFTELKEYIWKVMKPSIEDNRKKVEIIDDRVDVTEKDISTLDTVVEENTEEILATKAEVEEVKRLIGLLVFELTEQGVKIEFQELLDQLELIE